MRGKTAPFVGIKGGGVAFDAAAGDAGVGVFAVVECPVHLETHLLFETVEDNGSNQRHLLIVGRLLLDNGSNRDNPEPRRIRILFAVVFGQCLVPLDGVVQDIADHLRLVKAHGKVIGIGNNHPVGIRSPAVVLILELLAVQAELFT